MMVGCDEEGIRAASGIIRDGGVAIFPTDTVYGIGCDPYDKGAVSRIYEIKSRDPSKSLPVLAHSIESVRDIAELDDVSLGLAQRYWPGQLTMILGLRDRALRESMGIADRIAVRVPGSGCALRLLERCGPLVGTSANLSGAPSSADPKSIRDVECDVFVDGGIINGGGESTIIEVRDGKIAVIRQGALEVS